MEYCYYSPKMRGPGLQHCGRLQYASDESQLVGSECRVCIIDCRRQEVPPCVHSELSY